MIFGILGAMVGSVTYAILAGLLRAFNRRYNARRPTVLMQFSQRGVKSPKYTFLQFSTQVCPKSPPIVHAAPRENLRKKCNNII